MLEQTGATDDMGGAWSSDSLDCRTRARALPRLDFPFSHMVKRTMCSGWLGRYECFVALDRRPVRLLDGPEPGGDPRFAGGDGLAVAAAVGALGQVLAGPLDLTEVGFSLVGVNGDGVHDDVGSGGVKNEANRLALGIPTGQDEDARAVVLWPRLVRDGAPLSDPLMELGKHHISPVDLVARSGEVLPDRAELGAAVDAVLKSLAACGWSG